jgi:hypothetical protein
MLIPNIIANGAYIYIRPQRISALFELLMDFIGSKYLDIAMDT